MALPVTHRQVVWIRTFYKLKSYSRLVSEGLRLSLWWWMFLCAPWEAVQLYYSHCFAARLTFLKMVLSSSQRLSSYLLGCVQWVTRCWSKIEPGISVRLLSSTLLGTWLFIPSCVYVHLIFPLVLFLLFWTISCGACCGVFLFFLSYQVTEKTCSFPSVTCNPYQHDSLQEQVQR